LKHAYSPKHHLGGFGIGGLHMLGWAHSRSYWRKS
jgi:hypothetical protein